MPLILDETHKAGKIRLGANILFAAVGSGWTYGASIIKWSNGK
jgi:3-oxoacyl-[acyl-carrier-protein] synthase III